MKEKKKPTQKGVRRIFRYVFRYKWAFVFTIIFSTTYAAGQIGGILQLSDFLQESLIGANLEKVSLITVGILLGFGLLWTISHYFAFLASNTLAVSVIHDLRDEIYQKLIDLPVTYYKKNQSGEILSRILNDISVIEIFLMNIVVHIVAQPVTVIAIVVIMLVMSPKITLYFFGVVPVIGAALGGLGSLVQNRSNKVQENISDITSHIQETVYGIEVIKGYAVEPETKDKFITANARHLKSSKKELRVRLLGTPVTEFLGLAAILIILVLGAVWVNKGLVDSSVIFSFLLLALVLSQPLSQVGNIAMVLKKLAPAANRIFEIIDAEESEDMNLPEIGSIKGKIEFRKTGFEYNPGQKVLRDINLSIEPGETVAIVGPSGSGKSTLISMIPIFNRPIEGQVLIDGKDIATISPRSIRKQLSLVTQETILFSGTIKENIRLSRPDASDEDIYSAAKIANAHYFIEEIPEGYDSLIGEKGVKLSGGQRQRIVLARAILRNPKILILDEATSSLDAESEKQITEAMKRILGKQTTLIITHKLSTIASADKIIVIENGGIIESGTHEELMNQKGIYNKLYQIQLNV